MRTNSKEYIYHTIFKLFLSKHYKLVTITDMEKATGLTRGAIFHYTHDKLSLFQDIVDAYFFRSHVIETKMNFLADENVRNLCLKDFIHHYAKMEDHRLELLENLLEMNRQDAIRSYLSFLTQAQDYYPNFNEKLNEITEREIETWEIVLTRADKNGETTPRADSKNYARIFSHFCSGICYQNSFEQKGIDIQSIEEQLMNLYKIIQK